ncbi:MAG: ribbon-helix-helix protein, CopG family [Planctomycetes bacterium]|nr:ribbon-helix-helix protein, CopG family [Planctomycetota bacterium]
MFGGNVKLDKALLERVKKYAEAAGYSSVDEFIAHAIEKELTKLDEAKGGGTESDPAVLERLRGLGYIE